MLKNCRQCSAEFEITDQDLEFLENVSPMFQNKKESVPPPGLCPDCRFQQRLSFRNLRNLSHRKCDFTGKAIISCYRDSSPHTVYHSNEWWGDGWDALSYGRDFDFSRPFFEQFHELYLQVPVVHQYATHDIENSEYVNGVGNCKNCYLSFMMDYCEDCYYVSYAAQTRSSIDCLGVTHCELCYECVDCRDCYNLFFAQRSVNCSDSILLSDCQRCKHCIGCSNLVDKEYCIFNKQCTPEEFEAQNKLLLSGGLERATEQFREWLKKMPKKYYFGNSNESFSGDSIHHIKNSFHCFDAAELENCKYCNYAFQSSNCMDLHVFGDRSSWLYQCTATGQNCSNDLFCLLCWNSSNNLYCHLINGSQNCFGCSGLKSKKYCILNKQYTKEDYERLVPKIIAHMRKTGEWGEYFPVQISAFGYNDSEAQEYFPLSKKEATEKGWRWQDEDRVEEKYMGPEVEIPETIEAVDESICSKILVCTVTGKPYKIIPQELKFYKQTGIPLPKKCPEQRHRERWALRNPRHIWVRKCDRCQKDVETTYALDRPEIVYCEECYLSTVY